MILHLGVVEIPYVMAPPRGTVKKPPPPTRRAAPKPNPLPSRKSAPPAVVTTADVAQWLENKYHVMEVFYEENAALIVEQLENSLQGALEDLLLGKPVAEGHAPFAEGASKIEERFNKYIENREIEEVGIPGVPTQAAKMGVRTRLKRRRGAPRQSFDDTGTYLRSFKVWVS